MNKLEFFDYTHVEELSNSKDIKERVKFNPEYISEIKEFFNADPKDRITLLQSVRGANGEMPPYVSDFLNNAKDSGKKVFIPINYNYQQDETGGVQICNNMRLVIEQSGTIAVAYTPASEGTKFDFGIAIYNDKQVALLNPDLTLENDLLYDYMLVKSNSIPNSVDTSKYFVIKEDIDDARRLFKEEIIDKKKTREPLSIILNYFNREGKPPGITLPSIVGFGATYASRYNFKINPINRFYDSDTMDAKFIKTTSISEQLALEEKSGNMKSYTRVATTLEKLFNS